MTDVSASRGQQHVTVRETHIGVVFLLGDRAYKLKKPVDLGFLNFGTAAARLRACEREVELNRRLAPDVYLGVANVTDPTGRPCEHLVVMRRMPEDRRLSTLVRDRAPIDDELRHIARVLAAFHTRCDRGPAIAVEGSRDALQRRWAASFDQLRQFHRRVLDAAIATEVERLTSRFLAGREALLAKRMTEHFVLDGHGDLLADDIFCLPDGPRILDCLEFDDRLRYLDQLDDAAFLAMDLEHLGAPDLAARFLSWYVEFVGDPAPPSLLHHYLAYRAFVRAKVSCLRYGQGDAAAADVARELTDIAHRHLATSAVALVLVGGFPGTGKSTVAGGLADRLGAVLISSDRVRKELAGIDPEQDAAAPYRQGIYAPAWTERTYIEMLGRAERLLALGESVVLDASWTDPRWRSMAVQVAERSHTDLATLRCEAPPEVAEARLRERSGVSDANASIAAAMRAETGSWPGAKVIDTTGTPDSAISHAVQVVRPRPAEAPWLTRRPALAPD